MSDEDDTFDWEYIKSESEFLEDSLTPGLIDMEPGIKYDALKDQFIIDAEVFHFLTNPNLLPDIDLDEFTEKYPDFDLVPTYWGTVAAQAPESYMPVTWWDRLTAWLRDRPFTS